MSSAGLVTAFQKRSGYLFKDSNLLTQALTHSSQATTGDKHNERLEFLGDRVLALIIAEELYKKFPNSQEGEMALRLNSVVRKETCANVARDLELDKLMRSLAGAGGVNHDVFGSQNVLGDACEAVLAAVYLDGGLGAAQKFVLKSWGAMLTSQTIVRKDPKSALQEWALGKGLDVPVYREVSRVGPDHAPEFVMAVEVTDQGKQQGQGSSKRIAEQVAAEMFMKSRKIKF